MNAISYSLFGYGTEYEQSLNFKSYLRGLELNIRVAEQLYGTEWKVVVHTDEQTYTSPYGDLLKHHAREGKIMLAWDYRAELCKMMLWRLRPLFPEGGLLFDRVIMRDTDSLLCWKERQAVEYWVNRGRIVHAITDSVSHNIPLMGGMIGFMAKQFRQHMQAKTWQELLDKAAGYDFSRKGSDQDFLNRVIMPVLHMHMTEHYLKGMPYSYREDCHQQVQPVDIPGLDPERFRELDGYAFHIGAAGFQTDAVVKWVGPDPYYDRVEKEFPEVFYWQI